MNISKSINTLALLAVLSLIISSCGKSDPNADVNEMLQSTWLVQSIEQENVEVFPSLYTSQSYTFVQDDDFKGEGELTIVSAPVGSTAATTEEFNYVISSAGKTISWAASPKAFSVMDTVLRISYGNTVVEAFKEQ